MMYPVSALGPVTTAGIWVAALGVAGLLIRQIVPWIKQNDDADAKLIETLIARVQRLETKLDHQDRKHALEQRVAGHRLRNVTACFDAILGMLKVAPEKVAEIVTEIEAMRARQVKAEAEETKALYAAYADDGEAPLESKP